jgi:hypothetical protein
MEILKDYDRIPTVSEIARTLRCSPQFLYREGRLGRLNIIRLNGRTAIIFPDDLQSWLKTKTIETPDALVDRLLSENILTPSRPTQSTTQEAVK